MKIMVRFKLLNMGFVLMHRFGGSEWVHTGICQRNRLGVDVTEGVADGRNSSQRDGAHDANAQSGEDSWLLVRSPADIAEGGRPEQRGRHGCRRRSLATGRGFAMWVGGQCR